jgi:hypothetical protein
MRLPRPIGAKRARPAPIALAIADRSRAQPPRAARRTSPT